MKDKKAKLRKAKVEDAEEIANLIYYTEVNPEDVWGGENKEEFLDRIFSEAIEFYFLEQFVGWSESEGKIINIKNNEVSVSK